MVRLLRVRLRLILLIILRWLIRLRLSRLLI